MGAELYRQVRGVVLLGWVVAWNALLVTGMWIGGRWDFDSIAARVFALVALLATFGLALAIAYYEPVQSLTLRSRDNLAALRRDLWFVAILTGVGAAAIIVSFFAAT